MPVHKTITINSNTNVLIWKIEESFDELSENITLNKRSINRLNSMKSDLHRKGFLSVRQLLKQANYTDDDLIYDEFGKPHLKDGKFISITHSFIFSAIIISDDKPVGIDIEKQRDKIVKIAPKFTPIEAYKSIANHSALVSKLTVVWGAKESLYKIYGKKKLHFLKNIYIDDFSFESNETNKTTGKILYEGITDEYQIHFLETEGFTCVYAI
ncbi:4'-phosphopantetheinyl transferase superfamily protein [Tenacibaculum finnmarkense genomovar finnmarkense]|uniref:4'-phosphopantetheinyl transferase family protein n=1 Tax=Tenacibaculum finnmarkense TaxID=2781243 RepID=UPI001E3ADC93|nr:4'-phosphopantetheinyl transferase family protein [Tenacibaculum finnmarkense]MCD8412685.1 4'-phosphopantetheinyl transferase superfamily protein [Tenacibaculum finnmarkense genomovar ulcerans]MCD8417247.1 4'-phosphopantetheinyl transferase superfamily protein [Tenacibaculum finnmarkense genomovar finnmarkense]MCG8185630.1 4'-phosphopantetheinyl transferase superfamily protein [Tenacibaculum finnmarkense genomovar finnmarkense]MCG8202183.1 4'-phosphopantetheinyl transferase superfamily prote